MNKILNITQAIKISKKLNQEGKKIVLAGGCFDILHIGHVKFIETAKKYGNNLIILLESDKTIRKNKGSNRPINKHRERATVLSTLGAIDYIVLLPEFMSNAEYDKLVIQLKPAIIATTKGDPYRHHKERQAKLLGGEVVDVIDRIAHKSSTEIARLIKKL